MTSRLPSSLFSVRGYGAPTDFGLLLIRLFFGLALAFGHGVNKWPPSDRFVAGVREMDFPAPIFFAWASAFAELICGILIAMGFSTRIAATIAGINMIVAAFIRQAGDPFGERELALAYLIAFAALVFTGAGGFSLDAFLGRVTVPKIPVALSRR